MSEAKYVWEVWRIGRRPGVKRYRLVKLNPAGGATVLARDGSHVVIRPANGKKFFIDEAEMVAYYRACLEADLERARVAARNLAEDLARPDLGMIVEVIPFERAVKLKTE